LPPSRSPPSQRPTCCSKNFATITTQRKSIANCVPPRKPHGTWRSRKTAPLYAQLQTAPGGPTSGVCALPPKSAPISASPSALNASASSGLAAPLSLAASIQMVMPPSFCTLPLTENPPLSFSNFQAQNTKIKKVRV
jgi:hypothetical protein